MDTRHVIAQAPAPDSELFCDVFNASPIGIAVRNLEGQLLFANRFLCSMLGFSEEEMRSRHCVDFSHPEDAEKDSALFQQLRAGLIDRYQTEKRFIRRDGSLIWGRLSVSLSNRTSPLVVAIVEDITEKRSAEEARFRHAAIVESSEDAIARDITGRKLAEAALADVSRKLVEIQERERTRIARELHDDINQRLGLLVVEIDILRLNAPDELSHRLTEVYKEINEVSAGVQLIAHQLHSPQLEFLGLVSAMKGLCREFATRQKVEIDFKNDDIPQRLSNDTSLCLFRILQEALHNAAKHSGVRQFEVRLGCSSNQLHLTVSDRGAGFDVESPMNKGGLGLTSMHERVRLMSGTILIESKPMAGTTIHVCVPFELERRSQLASG
jgi:PAS domain S-box-containing protein